MIRRRTRKTALVVVAAAMITLAAVSLNAQDAPRQGCAEKVAGAGCSKPAVPVAKAACCGGSPQCPHKATAKAPGEATKRGCGRMKHAMGKQLTAIEASLDAATAAVTRGDKAAALAELAKAKAVIAQSRLAAKQCCPAGKPTDAAAAGKPVNARCPIMGSTLDPNTVPANLTREFNGQKVGFCCGSCPAAWDRLTDAQRAAKLQGALPKPVAAAPAAAKPTFANTHCPIMGSTLDPNKVPANLTRAFNGQKIGFCCGGCPAAWDRLTDAQKQVKLTAASK